MSSRDHRAARIDAWEREHGAIHHAARARYHSDRAIAGGAEPGDLLHVIRRLRSDVDGMAKDIRELQDQRSVAGGATGATGVTESVRAILERAES